MNTKEIINMEVIEGGIWCGFKQHYEIDYINFMIQVLKPFIIFTPGPEGNVSIYRPVKRRGVARRNVCTVKEYVYFIQKEFPEMIKGEMEVIKSDIRKMNCEKDAFFSFLRLGEKSFITEYLNNDKMEKDLNVDYNKIIEMKWDEIEELREYYGIKDDKLNTENNSDYLKEGETLKNKLNYFDQLLYFNFTKHCTIDSILKFLKNLEYIELK